jgi:hypothetical protein
MKSTPFRLLLAGSSLVLALGGPLHAAAFNKAASVLGTVNLPPFYTGSFKVLWLADSATLLTLAVTFGFIAVRPAAASRPVVLLLALIPAATAGLIYHFVGSFIAAHLLMTAALAAFVAGLLFPTATPS